MERGCSSGWCPTPPLPTSPQQARPQVPVRKEQKPHPTPTPLGKTEGIHSLPHQAGREEICPQARRPLHVASSSQGTNTRKGWSQKPPKPRAQTLWQGAEKREKGGKANQSTVSCRATLGPSLESGRSGGDRLAWQRAACLLGSPALLGLNQPLTSHVIWGESVPLPSLSFPPCKMGLLAATTSSGRGEG